jgi:hypothetical protein
MSKSFLLISILLFLLFTSSLISAKADEKDSPKSYQYTFTVGSTEFSGVVDGEEGRGVLLDPIALQESGRSGIDLFFVAPNNMNKPQLAYDIGTKTSTITFETDNSTLTMIHPSQEYFIDEKKLPSEFNIMKTTNEQSAHWKDIEFHSRTNYLIPLRLVFEFTGHKVDWNPDTQEITVTYPVLEAEE